ncbi:MAG: TIGR00296 family protein [archaeon]|nr:MAG: TIGR00296 family protein [archaeon]
MLTLTQGRKLVKLARKSIDFWFKKKQLHFSEEKKLFKRPQGVFITLNTYPKKQLRGCIGFPYPSLPLAEAVFQTSRSAAFSDPRFDPITEKEFKKIIIEVSVLTVPEQIHATGTQIPNEIQIGKDGLIVQFSGHSGLLLPQVAKEYKWTPMDFLRATCNKAGLPSEIWLNPQTRIYKFQAQIFSEKKPKGAVTLKNGNKPRTRTRRKKTKN